MATPTTSPRPIGRISNARASVRDAFHVMDMAAMTPEQRQRFTNTAVLGGKLVCFAPKGKTWGTGYRDEFVAALSSGSDAAIAGVVSALRRDKFAVSVLDNRAGITKRRGKCDITVLVTDESGGRVQRVPPMGGAIHITVDLAHYDENLRGLRELVAGDAVPA